MSVRVRYEGGELDGQVVERVPVVFAEHPQREVTATDGRHELYRRRGAQSYEDRDETGELVERGTEHVFVFVDAHDQRVLDDNQNPLPGTELAQDADGQVPA